MSDDTEVQPIEVVEFPEPAVDVPVPAPPVPAEPVHPIASLPRYTHGLLGQSLVGTQMIEQADGEWIRRADVLKLL